MTGADIQATINQLADKASSKRRAAAKALRKNKISIAGPNLLIALKKEIFDTRTWETQYQMIMAIAECGYTEALDFLVEMSNSEQKSKILYVALGDAITRLLIAKTGSADTAIEKAIQTGNSMLLDGAMRATAMLNLIPTDKNIEKIITYGNTLDINDCHRAWIAAASAGWHGTQVDCFLDDSIKSTNQQTKRAATAALKKQYLKWSPL